MVDTLLTLLRLSRRTLIGLNFHPTGQTFPTSLPNGFLSGSCSGLENTLCRRARLKLQWITKTVDYEWPLEGKTTLIQQASWLEMNKMEQWFISSLCVCSLSHCFSPSMFTRARSNSKKSFTYAICPPCSHCASARIIRENLSKSLPVFDKSFRLDYDARVYPFILNGIIVQTDDYSTGYNIHVSYECMNEFSAAPLEVTDTTLRQ